MKRLAFLRLATLALALVAAAALVASATAKGPFGGTYQTTIKGQVAALNGPWLITFTTKGGYTVTKKPSPAKLIVGTATLKGNVLSLRDSGGPLACKGAATNGSYVLVPAGKKLTFKILKDPCPGRPLILASASFTKIR